MTKDAIIDGLEYPVILADDASFTLPALAALFLYGLLPIVRNTHAGLASIPGDLREAALALGLSPWERMRHVELPLAQHPFVIIGSV